MKTGDLPALTIARYFAALGVIWYHFARKAIVPYPGWPRGLINSGYSGVTFFFVLSGFILTYAYHRRGLRERAELHQFIVHRIARIYPVYMLAWVLYGLVAVACGYRLIGIAGWGGLSALLVQAWIPSAAQHWNWPGWSLSTEALFYACFPALLIWSGRLGRRGLWLTLVTLLVADAAYIELVYKVGAKLVWRGTPFEDSLTSYLGHLPLLLLPLFGMGVMLGNLFLRRESRPVTPPWILVAIIGIVLATLSLDVNAAGARYRDISLTPEFCALIFALACARIDTRSSMARAGIALGKASYALYIIQLPLWMGWRIALKLPNETRSIPEVALFALFTTAASLVVYRYIERPAEGLIRSSFTPDRGPVPAPDTRATPGSPG